MSQELCYYHPSKSAVDKCQRCNQLICLSDKMVIQTRRSSGVGNTRSYYSITYIFCPICKYESNLEAKDASQIFNKLGSSIIIGFFIIAAIMIISFFNSINQSTSTFQEETNSAFRGMFIFMTIGVLMVFLVFQFGTGQMKSSIDSNIAQSRKERDQFLETVENKSFRVEYQNDNVLICNQCGSSIPKNSLFCMNCGDTTKDELNTK